MQISYLSLCIVLRDALLECSNFVLLDGIPINRPFGGFRIEGYSFYQRILGTSLV